MFNIHAMMLDDADFVDAIKEIINGQHMCAEYAVKKAGEDVYKRQGEENALEILLVLDIGNRGDIYK